MAKTRVMIVDDTTLVRRLLAQQLSREPDLEIVAEAQDGRQAVDLCLSIPLDVIVMDLDMPRMNGIEATERIRALRPKIRIILLTLHKDLLSLGRLSGAVECLDKGCTPQELSATIRRVASSAPNGAADASDYGPALERMRVHGGLSEQEAAVLEELVCTDDTAGRIATLLSERWSRPVTETAVKRTSERIMTKLGVEPRTRASLVKLVLEQDRRLQAPSQ